MHVELLRIHGQLAVIVLVLFVDKQFDSSYALACSQNPPSSYSNKAQLAGAHQAPIHPITENTAGEHVEASTIAAEASRHASSNVSGNPIRAVSEKLNEMNASLGGAAEEVRSNVAKAFRDAGQSVTKKLRNSQLYLSEKFRPLAEAATQIFNKPGTTDKQRWDQLVQRVDLTNLSGAEKRDFFQKFVDTMIQKQK